MPFTTVPQPTLPENRPTQLVAHPSGYILRTAPYDPLDPGPWPWRPTPDYRRDLRTGRHRRSEAPDPYDRLREAAWVRFLTYSEPLAKAHTTKPRPGPLRTLAAALRGTVHRITRTRRVWDPC